MAPARAQEDDLVKEIERVRNQVINLLYQRAIRAGGIANTSDPNNARLYHELLTFLEWLETIDMTPRLKERARIEMTLNKLRGGHFPPLYRGQAIRIYDKWVAAEWNTLLPEPTPEPSRSDNETPGHRRRSSQPIKDDRTEIQDPPASHPIWGDHGIMHGIAVKLSVTLGGRTLRTKILDRSFPKRPVRSFGHNHQRVGQWYPSRLSTVFHGAHRHSQAGITGDGASGAYSIVVSGGEYDGMDADRGDELQYSGSDANSNTDPTQVGAVSAGTAALQRSLQTGNVVRVLRTDKAHSRWRPTVAIRYDGLYRVVDSSTARNARGGLYERFKLERGAGQPPLDGLRARPTVKEQRDLAKVDDWVKSCQWIKRSNE